MVGAQSETNKRRRSKAKLTTIPDPFQQRVSFHGRGLTTHEIDRVENQLSAVNAGSAKNCSTQTQQAKSMFGAVRVPLSVVPLPPYASILVNGSHV